MPNRTSGNTVKAQLAAVTAERDRLRAELARLQESATAKPIIVTNDAPPPDQVVRTNTQYQIVEGDNLEARAWQAAVDEKARNPQNIPFLESLTSLQRQFLKGFQLIADQS